jgi:hypothetical protein
MYCDVSRSTTSWSLRIGYSHDAATQQCSSISSPPALPPPRAPPPPPNPLFPVAANQTILEIPVVTVHLEASGTVSDYDSITRANIAAAFADETGVTSDNVAVNVLPGSVIINVEVTVADAAASTSAQAALETRLANASSATSFLAAANVNITSNPVIVQTSRLIVGAAVASPTVASPPVAPPTVALPSFPPPSSHPLASPLYPTLEEENAAQSATESSLSSAVIALLIVAGVLAVLLVCAGSFCVFSKRKGMTPIKFDSTASSEKAKPVTVKVDMDAVSSTGASADAVAVEEKI